jgi:hypothetical protein
VSADLSNYRAEVREEIEARDPGLDALTAAIEQAARLRAQLDRVHACAERLLGLIEEV